MSQCPGRTKAKPKQRRILYKDIWHTAYNNIIKGSRHRRRIFPLTFSNELLGFLIVLEFNSPFEAIPEEKYKLVSGVIVKELSVEK